MQEAAIQETASGGIVIKTAGGDIETDHKEAARLLDLLEHRLVARAGVNLESVVDKPVFLIGIQVNIGRGQKWLEIRDDSLEAAIHKTEQTLTLLEKPKNQTRLMRGSLNLT